MMAVLCSAVVSLYRLVYSSAEGGGHMEDKGRLGLESV